MELPDETNALDALVIHDEGIDERRQQLGQLRERQPFTVQDADEEAVVQGEVIGAEGIGDSGEESTTEKKPVERL